MEFLVVVKTIVIMPTEIQLILCRYLMALRDNLRSRCCPIEVRDFVAVNINLLKILLAIHLGLAWLLELAFLLRILPIFELVLVARDSFD